MVLFLREAHECLAIAMNRLGGKSNSGEVEKIQKDYTQKPIVPLTGGEWSFWWHK